MEKDYGKVYKVFIELDKESLKTEDSVKDFMEREFPDLIPENEEISGIGVKFISMEGHRLELLWVVPDREGVHEIENELFYILDDGSYGTYSCEHIG